MEEVAKETKREEALYMYKETNGTVSLIDIAEKLGVKESTVKTWKYKFDWDRSIGLKKKKRGGQKGNRNAVGNRGGNGAKFENQNARKHGLYSKYLPADVYNIYKDIEDMSSIEILREQIYIKHANLLSIQKKIKSSKKGLPKFIEAESMAIKELRSMIKQYEDMIKTQEIDLLKEHKLKLKKTTQEIDLIKTRVGILKGNGNNTGDNSLNKLDELIKAVYKNDEI